MEKVSKIMESCAKEHELIYSHPVDNIWNMQLEDSNMLLSFLLNEGIFKPSISGLDKKQLEEFVNSEDISSNVKVCIKQYLRFVKDTYEEIDRRIDYENYQEYLKRYYAGLRAAEEEAERAKPIEIPKPTIEEEIHESLVSAKSTVKRLKPEVDKYNKEKGI